VRKLLGHRKLLGGSLVTALLLTACVTINVYFPAAQAQEAAKEFVDKVIGPADQSTPTPPPSSSKDEHGSGKNSVGMILLSLVVPAAEAQSAPDITIRTPAIQAIQARMAQRFSDALQPSFDSGALGFTRDGLVSVRDATGIPLKDRVAVKQAVADDNRDRQAVYREIAVANGHAEWESQIRATFAKQWIASAHKGWWYQDTGGAWKQK
jgi:uncharacterized protein YdbL (DUF1318 family)